MGCVHCVTMPLRATCEAFIISMNNLAARIGPGESREFWGRSFPAEALRRLEQHLKGQSARSGSLPSAQADPDNHQHDQEDQADQLHRTHTKKSEHVFHPN
jgi:hypothetical protein